MTAARTVALVARRELVERARSRAFVASTVVSLVIIAVVAVLPALLRDDGPRTFDLGLSSSARASLAPDLATVADRLGGDVELRLVDVADRADAEQRVRDGDLDAAVVDTREVVVDQELDPDLEFVLQVANAEAAGRAALAEAGVSAEEAAAALDPEPLSVRPLDPPDPEADDREGLVFVATLLLYGQLLGFGFWVASGLVEEKSSRVIELLLAKARPTHLLAGKVVGIGIAGFAQLLGFVVVGLSAASLSGSIDLPAGTGRLAVEVLAWFVLGYAFYSCLFAVGGALASRSEELQSTTTPVTLAAMGSFLVAVFAGSDPGGTLARVATFVPPATPMLLPIRSSAGELAWWELVVGVALVLVSIVVVVRLAARVYAGGALHLRGQLRLKDALARSRG